MKSVIELIRVSTSEQAGEDRAGIPAQREVNRRTARAYGLAIVRTIEIVDVSGAGVLMSPQMQALLRLIEDPEIHGVVAREFSRLMRPENFADFGLLQRFIETNTVLYLPDGPIDFSSNMGRFMGAIRAAVAGLERREIVERMMHAKEAMRLEGKHPGGLSNLPLGVGYTKEHGWFYTAEAEKVKQAFAMFLGTRISYTEIGQKLNLPRTDVQFILRNPIYTGWRVYDQKRDRSAAGYVAKPDGRQGYRRKIARAPEEVIRKKVLDGLVSEEDFARVQQLVELKRSKHWRVRPETTHRYTYNGHLVCAACKELLYTHSAKHDYYLCKTRHTRERRRREARGLAACDNRYMMRERLEPAIDRLLGERLQEPEFLRRIIEEYEATFERPQISNDSAPQAKLKMLEEKRQRVLESFFDGVITKADRDERVAAIDRDVEAYRGLLVASAAVPRLQRLDAGMVLEIVEPFAEWEFLGREDRRMLLATLCPEISVYRYAVRSLTLALPPAVANAKDGREKTAP